jgi:hypothetical protein
VLRLNKFGYILQLTTTLSLILSVAPVVATNYLRMAEAHEMRFGGNAVMLSAIVNPSLVAHEVKRSMTISVVELYGVKGLTRLTAGVLYPNKWLPLAAHVETFGFDAYRETMLRGAVARTLGRGWSLGVAIRYTVLQTELFDEQGTCLSADAGLRFAPGERFAVGLSLVNVASIPFGEGTAAMSSSALQAEAGMEWKIVERLRLLGSIAGGKDRPVGGNIAMEYAFEGNFRISGGIKTSPWLVALGAAYEGNRFTLDVANTVHPVLGMSWGVGLSVYF